MTRDSAADIATDYGLRNREVRVRFPLGKEFSLLHVIEAGSGAYLSSY
jgi:hypothetical protein